MQEMKGIASDDDEEEDDKTKTASTTAAASAAGLGSSDDNEDDDDEDKVKCFWERLQTFVGLVLMLIDDSRVIFKIELV